MQLFLPEDAEWTAYVFKADNVLSLGFPRLRKWVNRIQIRTGHRIRLFLLATCHIINTF